MPIYEYMCPKCKATVELHRKMGDSTLPLCCDSECGGIEMQKIISGTSFVLNGTGWARDGYGK